MCAVYKFILPAYMLVIGLSSSCNLTSRVEVSAGQGQNKSFSGFRQVPHGDVIDSDAILLGLASAVGAGEIAPLMAVSLVPRQATVILKNDTSTQLKLATGEMRLALVMVKSRAGDISLHAIPCDDSEKIIIGGLATGERLNILIRIISIDPARGSLTRSVMNEMRQTNTSPDQAVGFVKYRVAQKFSKVSNDVEHSTTAPASAQVDEAEPSGTTTGGNQSQAVFSTATVFQLRTFASNAVQSSNHPVVVTSESSVLDAASAVECSWSWGLNQTSSQNLGSCTFTRLQNKIHVNLPSSIEQERSGFGQLKVRLLDASSGATAVKNISIYISPSVAGLVPCDPPALLESPASLLASPSLATFNGQAFDDSTLSTNVRINISLSDQTNVIDKYSLRTTYQKVSYLNNDYIVIYKAWPAFTAQHYQSAVSHGEMCRIAREYKPKVLKAKQLSRYDAMVVSSSGVMVGVTADGQARRLGDAHQVSLTSLIGSGAAKVAAGSCSSLLPSSNPARVGAFCVNVED
jgi:hypothetical protein